MATARSWSPSLSKYADRDRDWTGAEFKLGPREVKGAVADPEQHRDLAGELVGDHDIVVIVAVEVPHSDRNRIEPGEHGKLPDEPTEAVADQDRDGILAPVGDHQVIVSVAVEVPDRDRLRIAAEVNRFGDEPEPAAPVADQPPGTVVVVVGDRKVLVRVAAELSHRHQKGRSWGWC